VVIPTPTETETPGLPPVSTATPTRTPTVLPDVTPVSVRLNEILPVPEAVNWDGRGRVNVADEWIELYNLTNRAVDISQWTLEVPGRRTTQTARLGRRVVIPAGGFLVLYGRDTRLTLDDAGGTVRLLDANGRLMDIVRYPALEGDQSYSRDDDGLWHDDWPPTPGEENVEPLRLRAIGTGTPAIRLRP
jgi:hypothetical protein